MNSYARVKSGYLSLEMVVQLATGGRVERAAGARGATPSGLGATLNFGYALPLYNVRCSAWDMACGSCNSGMARYFICRSVCQ